MRLGLSLISTLIYRQIKERFFLHFLTSGQTVNSALMELIWLHIKTQKAVTRWEQKDMTIMLDQLMNFVLSCGTAPEIHYKLRTVHSTANS